MTEPEIHMAHRYDQTGVLTSLCGQHVPSAGMINWVVRPEDVTCYACNRLIAEERYARSDGRKAA